MTDLDNLPRPKYVKFEREWRDDAKKTFPKRNSASLRPQSLITFWMELSPSFLERP